MIVTEASASYIVNVAQIEEQCSMPIPQLSD